MISKIRLSDVMPPAFKVVHGDIKTGKNTQFVLKGGRGCGKSSYVSEEIPLLLLKHPDIHAVVMRKVANTIRSTTYAQYQWAISELGLYDEFEFRTNPPTIRYKKTGQLIMFFGADDAGKLKSLKTPFGYVGILHFEELDQFNGEAEVRSIEQSVLRGGPIALEFKTFNPPKTAMNWANKYCLRDKPSQLIVHSTYLDMPEEWLGQRFIDDAEYLKSINPEAYEHEYLGVANGNGGNVFSNVQGITISDEAVRQFDRVLNGVDWGYYPDPFAFNSVYFDAARRDLYIFDEEHLYKAGNRESADALINNHGIGPNDVITCDSAEPKSIGDYKSYGLTARAVEKGAGSIEYSMKWLASLSHIYIDSKRCPYTWQEFTEYEYERDRDGNVVSGYPDRDNHHIDAVRYATNKIWKKRGL